MLGYAFCGSFCTHQRSLEELQKLIDAGYDVLPIFSDSVWTTDTRFGTALALKERVESICHKSVIHTVVDAEPIGPKTRLDALIVCPCTGNTLAKLASGITDTPVTMAAKAHLRQSRPLLISLATNDAMSANLKNISTMLEKKGVFFVPMKQDDCQKKPHSLVSEFEMIPECLVSALNGKQERPLFI